ncbi:MAG: hypothetical protein Q8N88_05995 [Nanoarchaeota archaeon]|nr:hypothetical protein [Nanoarchaeota archaeon]
MHYNQFSIDYIEAIKRNLKVEVNENGEALFFPDIIKDSDILKLKEELQSVWTSSEDSVNIVHTKYDATIQSGLFGLINDLDTALKIGFLLGDRVVLLDYLYERILLRKSPKEIDLTHLGVVSSSLVSILPLVQTGRIVIIPNPLNWYSETKKIIQEVSEKTNLTIDLMSLLNMVSITKYCQLHPYTIAESESNYKSIINYQIDSVDAIGKDGSIYAYEGILGALLSEKLLNNTELQVVLNIPISKYFEVISSNKDFYMKYLTHITSGGSLNAQNNIENLRNVLLKDIEERNKFDFTSLAKPATIVGGVGSSTIALASLVTVVSAPLILTGAVLALSATLTSLVNDKERTEDTIISVFNRLFST